MELDLKEEAIKCFSRTLEIDPNNVSIWFRKGMTFNQLSRFEEAVACYDKALQIDSDNVIFMFTKGLTLLFLDRADEANKCLEKANKLYPEYGRSYNIMITSRINLI